MAEQDTPSPGVDLYRVARIVGSYVQHHQIGSDQLAGLIGEVHRALASLGRAPPVQEPLMPAVPIRRSVQQDHVVCLECGYRAQVLRRHLRVAHDLEVADYRTRWKLPPDHPVTAPSYSARRSTMAKQLGLGRKPSTVDALVGHRRRLLDAIAALVAEVPAAVVTTASRETSARVDAERRQLTVMFCDGPGSLDSFRGGIS
jgi:predicted transcriptional regulator